MNIYIKAILWYNKTNKKIKYGWGLYHKSSRYNGELASYYDFWWIMLE